MTLTLYTTSSEKNRIGKTLTQQAQKTGVLRPSDNGNLRTPVITVEYSATVLSCNYAHISEYNRYYFIVNKTPISNDRIELQLKCDVLESFKNEIKNNEMLIDRSEYNTNTFLVDNSRPVFNYPMVLTKNFSTGFDSFKYYLTVASSNS